MPTYVYKCNSCEYTYEKRKKFSDDHDTECPKCDDSVRRVINSVGVVFKGSGFYVTDSRSNNSAAPNSKNNIEKSNPDEGSGKSSDSPADSANSVGDKKESKATSTKTAVKPKK